MILINWYIVPNIYKINNLIFIIVHIHIMYYKCIMYKSDVIPLNGNILKDV